jgi:hypothetical protein
LANIVALEFDTFRNTAAPVLDPTTDHFSMMTDVNHTSQIGAAVTGQSFGTSEHTVRIDYTPGTFDVYFDDLVTPALSVSLDLATINGGNTLDGLGGAFVGFTASTGLGTQNTDILSWSLSPIPEPASFVLAAIGLISLCACRFCRRR